MGGKDGEQNGVVNEEERPAVITAVPSGPEGEALVELIRTKMSPLWAQKPTTFVKEGIVYEVADFRVRVGELKQGQQAQVRGCLVEIEWLGSGGEVLDEGDWDVAEGAIRAFWERLDVKGGKEFIRVPGVGKGDLDLVRQYTELLRLRNER